MMAQQYISTFCGTQKQNSTPNTSVKLRTLRVGWDVMRTLIIAINIRRSIITSGTPNRLIVQPGSCLFRVNRWILSR